MRGIITKCVAGVYEVFCDGVAATASAAGKLRNDGITPLVGDFAELTQNEGSLTQGVITEILPRKNQLLRPPLANVARLLIVLAVKKPSPDLSLADTLILFCRLNGIEPVIVVNKSDYGENEADAIAEQYIKSGIKAVSISAWENRGLEEIKRLADVGITCLCGQSAVGKSTLFNFLLGKEANEIGGLSKKTERGRHTTRAVTLVPFGQNGFIADTPGFSLLDLPPLSPEELKELYFEFEPFAEKCRFNGCNHIHEPDCAVKRAAEEKNLSPERYERYTELYNFLSEKWRKRYD